MRAKFESAWKMEGLCCGCDGNNWLLFEILYSNRDFFLPGLKLECLSSETFPTQRYTKKEPATANPNRLRGRDVEAAPLEDEVEDALPALPTLADSEDGDDDVDTGAGVESEVNVVNETDAEPTVTSTLRVGVGIAEAVKLVTNELCVDDTDTEADTEVLLLAALLAVEEALETTVVASAAELSWLFTHSAATSE